MEKYGANLVTEMPEFVNEISTPEEVGVLAAEYKTRSLIELEGQLEGFTHIDLDKEGLSEYRSYLLSLGLKFNLINQGSMVKKEYIKSD